MAMPPRLIVLIVTPMPRNMITDMMIDSGSATSDTKVVRRFIRKKNRTIITISAPSSSEACRLLMELAMNSDCRKMSAETVTSGGRVLRSSSIWRSSSPVRLIVPVPGCLVMVSITDSRPLTEAVPMRGRLPPNFTVATSPTRRLRPCPEGSAMAATSSGEAVLTAPLTRYSLPWAYITLPAAFSLLPSRASSTSARVTPWNFIFSGERHICISLSSPPITDTCATPGVASSWRLI